MSPFHSKRTLLLASVARPVPAASLSHRTPADRRACGNPDRIFMGSGRLIRPDHTSPQAICGKETSCSTF